MFSIESQIRPRTSALKISLANLAILVGPGCSKAALSEASNGGNLNREVALRVDAKLRELETFVASLAPIKPDLSDARLVDVWLEEFKDKRTKPSPWVLLREANVNSPEEICATRGWTTQQLLAQLTAAEEKLHAMTASLATANADRARLHQQL